MHEFMIQIIMYFIIIIISVLICVGYIYWYRSYETRPDQKKVSHQIARIYLECVICLENLDEDDQNNHNNIVTILRKCGHKFHTICIKMWCIKSKVTWPICRRRISKEDWKLLVRRNDTTTNTTKRIWRPPGVVNKPFNWSKMKWRKIFDFFSL